MMSFLALCVFLICFSLPYSHQQTPAPLQLYQSGKSYGPDGPWHAVSVYLGDPAQEIDLYPGGASFASVILTTEICDGIIDKPCGSGGMYDPAASTSAAITSVTFQQVSDTEIDGGWTSGALLYQYSNASYGQDTLFTKSSDNQTVGELGLYRFFDVAMQYPDGTLYPVQVGQLALGNTDANQTFFSHDGPNINGTLITNYLHAQGITPSSSYGLHYGSVALGIDLSLWLGGYDITRVVGPVAAQAYSSGNNLGLTLLDIEVGVDQGASPFAYSTREGILAEGNDTITDGIAVLINPAAPYLNLPSSTCAALARDLPVTYNYKFGLYFWNVLDPQYERIVSSPAYLSFIFGTQNPVNLTIKVPFRLLNLTLEAPLTPLPTQYFPCQPPQDSDNQQYGLGRAFLQAAFVGVNWSGDEGQWYLAQAPGPGVSKTTDQKPIKSGRITESPIKASNAKWTDTWRNHWTSLPSTTAPAQASTAAPSQASTTNPPKTGGSNLTGGAKAGLAAGAVAVVLICLAIGWCTYRRKKSPSSLGRLPRQDIKIEHPPYADKALSIHKTSHEGPMELHNQSFVVPTPEISGSERYEMRAWQNSSSNLQSELP